MVEERARLTFRHYGDVALDEVAFSESVDLLVGRLEPCRARCFKLREALQGGKNAVW